MQEFNLFVFRTVDALKINFYTRFVSSVEHVIVCTKVGGEFKFIDAREKGTHYRGL